MGQLPIGTIRFLFTDIEGSPRLLTQFAPMATSTCSPSIIACCRAAFDRHDSHEVHTKGEAFFVALARARDAIAAALSAQRAPVSQRWPEGVEERVRMGIHTGRGDRSGGATTSAWTCTAQRGSALPAIVGSY